MEDAENLEERSLEVAEVEGREEGSGDDLGDEQLI